MVCSGAKSILDVSATAELLETLAVPVLGWQTATLPMFYTGRAGRRCRRPYRTRRDGLDCGRALGAGARRADPRPPAGSGLDLEELVTEAVERVRRAGISGQAVTPAVLAAVEELSDGRSVEVNRRLIADNAELAARVAVAYADLPPRSTMAPSELSAAVLDPDGRQGGQAPARSAPVRYSH